MPRKPVKKEAIDDAAIHLFANEGLVASTIKKIAKKAGVTEGALYRYYSSKEDMAWELFCKEVHTFIEGMIPMLQDTSASLETIVKNIVVYIYKYYENHADKLIFTLYTRNNFPDRFLEKDEFNPDEALSLFLKYEIKKGRIPKTNTELLLAMLRGLILEPIMMHRYGHLKTTPLKNSKAIVQKCLLVIKGEK